MSRNTRRGFLRALVGLSDAPKATFSLSDFYARRTERGEATGERIPAFEVLLPASDPTEHPALRKVRPS